MDSLLPEDDPPDVWIGDGKLIVSSSSGVAAPGEPVGVYTNAVRQPVEGEFAFEIELAAVSPTGEPDAVVNTHAIRTTVGELPTQLFCGRLPDRAPAWYRIATTVRQGDLCVVCRTYMLVPDQVLEAELGTTLEATLRFEFDVA